MNKSTRVFFFFPIGGVKRSFAAQCHLDMVHFLNQRSVRSYGFLMKTIIPHFLNNYKSHLPSWQICFRAVFCSARLSGSSSLVRG